MQNLHKKLTKLGNKRERMREKSDLWDNTNIADMHALLEGSWAATGQLCLSCCRLCLELTSCSCTVPPLPWDTPVTFLWQTRQLPMFPSVQMLQCFSLVGVLRCCIIRVQLSVQMLNCTKPEQGQGSQTWCSLSAHLCHVYAYINPIFFFWDSWPPKPQSSELVSEGNVWLERKLQSSLASLTLQDQDP